MTIGSRQIADHLAARIVDGTYPPGARIPSTRQIVAEYGVAMATASKALTELRHRGLVRAVPGVGTVVAMPDTPQPADPAEDAIVAAAVRIADAEGLEAVTMRRLGAELGASPMSLYRHLHNKDELVVRMREWAFGLWLLPATPPVGWRARIEVGARALWALYGQHPWLARTPAITRPVAGPRQLAYSEWMLATLSGSGLPHQTVFNWHLTLFNLVHGTASSLEAELREHADSGVDTRHWMAAWDAESRAAIGSGRFPHSQAVFSDPMLEFDLDHLFDVSLELLLDGMAVAIGRERSRGPSR